MGVLKCSIIFSLLFFSKCLAYNPLLPAYDENIEDMCFNRISPSMALDYLPDYQIKVPKKIHQIWFGRMGTREKKNIDKWKQFSKAFNYSYTLWDEKCLSEAANFCSPQNLAWILKFIDLKNFWAASDILRMEVLKEYGGIYMDCDFRPPTVHGELIDFSSFMNMKGITLVTEHQGRNIGNSAFFVCNGIVFSPPAHPVVKQMVEQFDSNIRSFYSATGKYEPMYMTGPFLLSSILSGQFQIIPMNSLEKFKVVN